MNGARPSVAVVGHVEWVQFARASHVPRAGEVVHARDPFEEPAGGGAVAAVQLARLAGSAALFTALGSDEHGERSISRLGTLGVSVNALRLPAPTRRAFTLVDEAGERTITTLGERLEPAGGSVPGLAELDGLDGVYLTAGDLQAVQAARAGARVLVASPRAGDALRMGVKLDALVLSGEDPIELAAAEGVEGYAEIVVWTEGTRGGRFRSRAGETGRWEAAPLPGERVDSYGCGDSFAAGFTFGLAAGMPVGRALDLAARCGARCLTGRGPYARQLQSPEI